MSRVLYIESAGFRHVAPFAGGGVGNTTPMALRTMVERLEKAERLDMVGDPLMRGVQAVLRGRVRDALHGVWLGHPLHPAMVQVPVGAWISAAVVDALPGAEDTATVLTGLGTAAAMPAAVAGLNDWASLSREQRRIGLIHASANVIAVGLYVGSTVARLGGNHRLGRRLGYAGLMSASLGAYLGGHLAYRQAAAVNVAEAFLHQIPEGWQDLCAKDALAEGKPLTARMGDVPVVVTRIDGGVTAMVAHCGHQTGPLAEGELVNVDGADCLVCPWHGSTFRLADGVVLHGPAATDQPVLRTREVAGRIQASLP